MATRGRICAHCVPRWPRAVSTPRSSLSARSRQSWRASREDELSAPLVRRRFGGWSGDSPGYLCSLRTFFTAAHMKLRSVDYHKGDTAPMAAVVIHTTFRHGVYPTETVASRVRFPTRLEGSARKGGRGAEGRINFRQDDDIICFGLMSKKRSAA